LNGTPLQDVYDFFMPKVNEDLTGKESLIFQYFKTAISKCYKFVKHDLTYTITDKDTFDGYFVQILDQDEVELIAMTMRYESLGNEEAYWISLRDLVSTNDFNSLPDKKRNLDGIQNSKRLLKEEIDDFKQQFSDYQY
jgi:hypothetical protein